MSQLTHWSQIHTNNPYAGFNPWPKDEHGWNADSPAFARLIEEVRPALVIEVGTWHGASALHMARCLRKAGLHRSRIVCVDTWLGSLEFWTNRDDPERYKALKCVNGYPTVFCQFISNVIHAGMEDVIIPFPNTSEIAALWMAQAGFQADLVYLDASHERDALVRDIEAWWPILRDGGVMLGDDLGLWPDIAGAIQYVFKNMPIETEGPKWWVRKV